MLGNLMSSAHWLVKGVCFDGAHAHGFMRQALQGSFTTLKESDLKDIAFFQDVTYQPLPDNCLPRLPMRLCFHRGESIWPLGGACAWTTLANKICGTMWYHVVPLFYFVCGSFAFFWNNYVYFCHHFPVCVVVSCKFACCIRPRSEERGRTNKLVSSHDPLRKVLVRHIWSKSSGHAPSCLDTTGGTIRQTSRDHVQPFLCAPEFGVLAAVALLCHFHW